MSSKDHDRPEGHQPGEHGASPDLSVSRRNFLKTVGVGPIAAGVLASQLPRPRARFPVLGPGEVPIELTINGRKHALRVEPRVTLLDALRTRLDITGQKRVCDRGSCGACTMLVDGRTVYACSMLAIEAAGQGHPHRRGSRPGHGASSGAAGAVRDRRHDVRLLHAGIRRLDGGAAGEAPQPDRRAGAPRAGRQHLPLRHLPARARSGARGVEGGVPWLTRRRSPKWPAPARAEGTQVRLAAAADAARPAHPARGRPGQGDGCKRSTPTTSRGPGCSTAASCGRPHAHARITAIDLAPARRMPGVLAAMPVTLPPARR